MNDPRLLSIKDFTYSLPDERIAKYPLPERDSSRLLTYNEARPVDLIGRRNISEDIYRNIADHIPVNSLLVFNDTKVVEARLLFQKPTGGVIEIFCLDPHQQYPDITTAMLQHEKVLWHCLIGGASKWKRGQILEKKIIHKAGQLVLNARYIEKVTDSFIVELTWTDPSISFAEVLHLFGATPLPPYIKREVEQSDAERYQTVYAHYEGSVAAPTAGLHFTAGVFEELKRKNTDIDFITLHVGAGTFKPVKSETMQGHEMHAEYFTISNQFIQNLVDHLGNNIVAVGTTSLRTLESLYWLAVKLTADAKPLAAEITQWEPYDRNISVPATDALTKLARWMDQNGLSTLTVKTQLMIAPGYQFRIVNGLITNFHQPQSTLLLLVAAFIGDKWRNVYDYALENHFRFLSYGDGSLLWRQL